MSYRRTREGRHTIATLVVLLLLFGLAGTGIAAHPGPADAPATVEVLIGFHQPPGDAERALVEGVGGEIFRQFHIVDVIAARMTQQAADALAQHAQVRYVEPNGVVYALGQTVPWGIDRVFGDETYPFGTWTTTTGVGMTVAVLDTGIDENHEDLPVLEGGTNTIDDTHWGSDGHGHGTHVAGTVAALDNEVGVVGVGPEIGLYAVKVLDDGGGGTWESVTAGIEWAVDQGVPVLNMSLGGGESQTVQEACDAAYDAGHLLVAAAGNSGNPPGRGDNVIYPAGYDSVIAVAASDEDNNRAWFSSTGPAVELIAPGVSVLSTIPGDDYGTKSGTSMASPHAAGVAALAWSVNPGLRNTEIRGILQDTAEDLGLSSNHQGYGLARADLAVAAAAELDPTATGNIEGTVSDDSGAALEGATVAVEGTGLSARTDENGYYLLEDVPTEDQDVTASADGYESQTATVKVEEDQTVTQDFTLEAIPSYTVSGTVTDAGWDALEGAKVTIEETGQSDTTASDGTYEITDVEEGTYDITASKDGYVSQTKTETVDEDKTVSFVLEEMTGETIRVQVAAGIDDVNSGCEFTPDANEIYFGLDDSCGQGYWAGFRFIDVEIPQGATIKSAHLEFIVDGPYNNDVTVRLRGEVTGDAAEFSSERQPHMLTTTDSVEWHITDNWKSGTLVTTPEIVSVVQEIVNHGGWIQGNALIITGESTHWQRRRTSHRRVFAYERDPSSAAVLVVEYDLE